MKANGALPQRAVVVGASRGLGKALVDSLSGAGLEVVAASRTRPGGSRSGATWIECDVRVADDVAMLADLVGRRPLDLLIYNVGIWETGRFVDSSIDELANVIDTNVTGLIRVVHAFVEGLRAARGLVLIVGSTSGLPNSGASGLAYAGSKSGARGVGAALRESLRADGVRCTTLSIGSTATDLPLGSENAALELYAGRRMPVEDVLRIVEVLRTLSPAACVKEIWMPAQLDVDC